MIDKIDLCQINSHIEEIKKHMEDCKTLLDKVTVKDFDDEDTIGKLGLTCSYLAMELVNMPAVLMRERMDSYYGNREEVLN